VKKFAHGGNADLFVVAPMLSDRLLAQFYDATTYHYHDPDPHVGMGSGGGWVVVRQMLRFSSARKLIKTTLHHTITITQTLSLVRSEFTCDLPKASPHPATTSL
jgi:hypothetical protein